MCRSRSAESTSHHVEKAPSAAPFSCPARDFRKNGLGGDRENAPPPLPIVLTANRWSGLVDRVDEARQRLDATVKAGDIANYLLPTTLIPNPTHQAANLDRIRRLAGERDRFVAEILAAGFTEEATALTRSITDSWGKLANATPQTGSGENWAMPQSDFGRWLIGRAVSSSDSGATFAAIGSVQPNHLKTDLEGHLLWAENVNDDGIQITGWEVLNPALESLVARDFRRVFLPMGVILTLMLVVVFRHLGDLLLALGTLAFSGLALVTLSRWIPAIEWNTFNLAALPILFGTGLDYAIHMIFALRRSNGELAPVRRGISQALLFCGFSTAIGFGSLAFAASEGLATLGLVCAIGILLNMLAAIWLLPHWWRWSRRRVAP